MIIAVGGDHAGFSLKAQMLKAFEGGEDTLIDLGCYDTLPIDFPDIARKVCAMVLSGEAQRGIMFCGSGVGAAIACNKIAGIRACVCHDIYTAHQCVEHDDVQVIALGGQIIGPTVAKELIDVFLRAEFSTGEDYRRRVQKLSMMENEAAK